MPKTPVVKLSEDQRSSVTRWGKRIKTLAQKGKPGTPNRRILVRISEHVAPAGKKYELHPTKGFRRWLEAV